MIRHPARSIAAIASIAIGLAVIISPRLLAEEELPQVSKEGLQLQKQTKTRVVYVKPGASLEQYKRVAILDCYVEFAKDWQRNYNDDLRGTGRRVTTEDMDRIKTELAAEFKKVFTKELQDKGGYQVVDVAAPDVLVLRPAIINLAPNAPDLMTAGMNATVVSSAGQMTLYLELWDSASNTLLARVMDAQADQGIGGIGQMSNRVTNQAAADTILREWATALRKHLDAVKSKEAGQ